MHFYLNYQNHVCSLNWSVLCDETWAWQNLISVSEHTSFFMFSVPYQECPVESSLQPHFIHPGNCGLSYKRGWEA